MDKNMWWIIAGVVVVVGIGIFLVSRPDTINVDNSNDSNATTTEEQSTSTPTTND